jgi:hypothetical protein
VEAFLETRVTERNRQRCMRVILNLISGKGETHKAKPGESFLKGHAVAPSDDLDDLKRRAREWLPCKKGPNCLDTGHGWALNHPIQKLIEFKNHLLGVEAPKKRAVKRARDDPIGKIARLKALYDEDAITGEEFDDTKQQLLAQI